jgi:hypothetical protein
VPTFGLDLHLEPLLDIIDLRSQPLVDVIDPRP